VELVTVEQVRAHCRADPDDDEMLKVYTEAAEQQVQDFLNRRVYVDAEGLAAAVLAGVAGDDPMLVNPVVRAAVLLLTAHLYRNREAVTVETARELPLGVTQLLFPHRVGLGV